MNNCTLKIEFRECDDTCCYGCGWDVEEKKRRKREDVLMERPDGLRAYRTPEPEAKDGPEMCAV